jgi:hypothetical protein
MMKIIKKVRHLGRAAVDDRTRAGRLISGQMRLKKS